MRKGKKSRWSSWMARFDEENNIKWAERLKDAGVHVLYGLWAIRSIASVSHRSSRRTASAAMCIFTGNYNPTTARIYTDVDCSPAELTLAKTRPISSICSPAFASSKRWCSWSRP